MGKNVGKIDRSVRILFGFAIIGTGFVFQGWWGAIGLVPLVTGFINWCPVYSMLRINTCGRLGVEDSCGATKAG